MQWEQNIISYSNAIPCSWNDNLRRSFNDIFLSNLYFCFISGNAANVSSCLFFKRSYFGRKSCHRANINVNEDDNVNESRCLCKQGIFCYVNLMTHFPLAMDSDSSLWCSSSHKDFVLILSMLCHSSLHKYDWVLCNDISFESIFDWFFPKQKWWSKAEDRCKEV